MGEQDASEMQRSIDKQIGHLFKAKREEEDRNRLFGDRGGNGKSCAKDDYSSMLKERDALQRSSQMLDDMIGQGQATLTQMIGQNAVLKGAKRKLLDVASSIGVSNSLVGVI